MAAAREAGAYLRQYFGKVSRIEFKGEINLVTEADRRSEEIVVTTLQKAFPDYGCLAEERGGKEEGYTWVIDPLDGTTNYAHRFPVYCVSIGLIKDGRPLVGVVYDPSRDELFVAERGQGATLNGQPIQITPTRALDKSLLATGFSYRVKKTRSNLGYFEHFIMAARAVRRAGAAALDLAYIACGRFDGFWELDLHPWDTAAAWLLIEEAGGKVTDFRGGPFTLYLKEMLASNGQIHQQMLEVLAKGDVTG